MIKLRRPSPALVVALVALFSSLTGTAVAASVVPLAKKALFANNAGKLQGRTAAQVAQLPGPATSAAGLVSIKSATDSLAAGQGKEIAVTCDAGTAIAGGHAGEGLVVAFDSRQTSANTWSFYLANIGQNASGVTVQAVCVK